MWIDSPAHLNELVAPPEQVWKLIRVFMVHALRTSAILGVATPSVEEALAISFGAMVAGTRAADPVSVCLVLVELLSFSSGVI